MQPLLRDIGQLFLERLISLYRFLPLLHYLLAYKVLPLHVSCELFLKLFVLLLKDLPILVLQQLVLESALFLQLLLLLPPLALPVLKLQ